MQKLIETLKQFGIEIPEDKHAEVKTALSEHYKNVGEHNKDISKLETERDKWKEQAETAEETLKSFEGIDPTNMQKELADWKKKAEDAQAEFDKKIAERDFYEMLGATIREFKGKNEKAIIANLDVPALMNSKNQKEDVNNALKAMAESESTGFLFDSSESSTRAQFTQPFTQTPLANLTREQIMAIKDPVARLSQIETNKHLFRKG